MAMGPQASKDLDYCFEILDGRHKLGYTFYAASGESTVLEIEADREDISLEEFLRPLFNLPDKSEYNIYMICKKYGSFSQFVAPLVNREWRLGIGKSLLKTRTTSPMLAKKYEEGKLPWSTNGYYITEKLDGNRCIAQYDEEQAKWVFTSRSGKPMRVNFDMEGMSMHYVYDGEVLSREQIKNPGQANFNSLSGIVNSKYGDKQGLVYVIFDIVDDASIYEARRSSLEAIRAYRYKYKIDEGSNTQILPVLKYCANETELNQEIPIWLDEITKAKGEGLMVNLGNRYYEQKRTNALLKVKLLQTMDMRVVELYEGTGKHAGRVGAMLCICEGENGNTYECRVGTGLSDEQREAWANDPDNIIGKIVEVAYFSISQDAKTRGSKQYSLRFPRLKRIRTDKEDTSEH